MYTQKAKRYGRLTRREGDERFGQDLAKASIGTRGYRLLKGEACRLGQNHPSVKARESRKEVLGDRGVPGGEVPFCGAAEAYTRHA